LGLSQAEFDQLVTEHGPALYRMAYRLVGDRHEAEDMVQDAYRSAWKGRGLFHHGLSERGWMITILRRRVADRWRRRAWPSVLAGDTALEIGVDADDPLENGYTDEMQDALNRLPRELRETLLLVVVGELTHQEAADLLRIPLGTVLSRVSRARQRLRKSLLSIAAKRA
jgi:RNA polymerase sigma-70 factor, ECF subfamily